MQGSFVPRVSKPSSKQRRKVAQSPRTKNVASFSPPVKINGDPKERGRAIHKLMAEHFEHSWSKVTEAFRSVDKDKVGQI